MKNNPNSAGQELCLKAVTSVSLGIKKSEKEYMR